MWTEDELKYLKDNYGKKTYKEMSLFLNKKAYVISKKVSELGIKFGKGKNPSQIKHLFGRKTSVNDSFFENPNLINCYWAGFIAADGNIRNHKTRKELAIQISLKDVQHLETFVKQVSFDGALTKYTRKNGISMCSIHINSNKICEDLEKNFNIIPKKTFILKPPANLKEQQKDCFIAGYIDGDGCIRKFKTKYNSYYSIDARGTKEIIEFIKEHFKKKSENGIFGNRFKCGSIQQEDITKNHFRYKICGLMANQIIEEYKKYEIPLLKRKWYKEE